MSSKVDFVDIRDPDSPEFIAVMNVYQGSMPAQVQQPVIVFRKNLVMAREGILPDEDYHLIGLKHKEQIIGMTSFSYFREANLGFAWYTAIKSDFQGQGFGKILLAKRRNIMCDDAQKINKRPKGLVIEVEKEEAKTPEERDLNMRRIRFFRSQGASIIRGIDYWQPPLPLNNLPAIPLYLMVYPWDREYWVPLSKEKTVEVIEIIYEKAYILGNDVPKSVATDFVRKIIGSINSRALRLEEI